MLGKNWEGNNMKREENEEIEVSKELMEAINRLLRERPELGYRDTDQFVTDAISRFLEKQDT